MRVQQGVQKQDPHIKAGGLLHASKDNKKYGNEKAHLEQLSIQIKIVINTQEYP